MTDQANEPSLPPAPSTSQPKIAYQPSAEESELLRLSREWTDVAMLGKNETRLRELMSPDFTLQVWDASRAPLPFEAWLDTLLHHLDQLQFEHSGLNARIFGDVGVVYSRYWWQGTLDGRPFKDGGFIVDIWVRQRGGWWVVARRSALQQQIQLVRDVGKCSRTALAGAAHSRWALALAAAAPAAV